MTFVELSDRTKFSNLPFGIRALHFDVQLLKENNDLCCYYILVLQVDEIAIGTVLREARESPQL